MPTLPPPVDVLPEEPSSSRPTNFAAIMDTFLAAMAPFRAQLIALATNCYNNALEAYNSATSAASSANTAAAQANAATALVNAPMWVSDTNYTDGYAAWSPLNYQTYRRKGAGAGTIDPSLDKDHWVLATDVVANPLVYHSITMGLRAAAYSQ